MELIARAIGDSFSGYQIVQILKSEGIPEKEIDYPNTKWKTLLDAFKKLEGRRILVPKKGLRIPYGSEKITSLINVFIHPLTHNADEEKATVLGKKIESILKYEESFIAVRKKCGR